MGRGRITRQPAIVPSQSPGDLTQVNSTPITEGKSISKCYNNTNSLLLVLMCDEQLAEDPPTSSSTQQLLTDEAAAKETYFGSFEQDSFDLEDCFNGSTQPENSDLLKNRMAERKGEITKTGDKDSATATLKNLPRPTSPPSRAESEVRTMESVASSAKASTPLKYQQYKLGMLFPSANLEEIRKRTDETRPLNAIVNDKIKLTLTELRQAVNEDVSP